jgi:hypothetical protein
MNAMLKPSKRVSGSLRSNPPIGRGGMRHAGVVHQTDQNLLAVVITFIGETKLANKSWV